MILLITASMANALPQTYNGALQTTDGIQGVGSWGENLRIEWTVTQQVNNSWYYRYQLTDTLGRALEKAISHWYIEVSPNVTENDFWGFGGDWEFVDETHGGTSFPNALKLDYGDDDQIEWSFYSWKVPVWGDFYLKGGSATGGPNSPTLYAWNAGFNNPDPSDPASDGSIGYKVLRPDSVVIPEPTTLGLVGLGLLGFGLRRFRKK